MSDATMLVCKFSGIRVNFDRKPTSSLRPSEGSLAGPSQAGAEPKPPLPPRSGQVPSPHTVTRPKTTSSNPSQIGSNVHPALRRSRSGQSVRSTSSSNPSLKQTFTTSHSPTSSKSTTFSSDTDLHTSSLRLSPQAEENVVLGSKSIDFEWDPSLKAKNMARQCRSNYRCRRGSNLISMERVIEFNSISESDQHFADSAWSLLSPDSYEINTHAMSIKFFEIFFHLFLKLKDGVSLPSQVPISVRIHFDSASRDTWIKYKSLNDAKHLVNKAVSCATYIKEVEAGSPAGVHLAGVAMATLLEVILNENGLIHACETVNAVVNKNQKLEGLMSISLSQASNLLATYVRSVGKQIFHDEKLVRISEKDLLKSINFLSVISVLIGMERMERTFRPVLDKLDERELPLWLWLFLETSYNEKVDIRDLYVHLKERHSFVQLSNNQHSAITLVVHNIIGFLLRTGVFKPHPFFDHLHKATQTWVGAADWHQDWEACGQRSWFVHQRDLYDERQRSQVRYLEILSTFLQSED